MRDPTLLYGPWVAHFFPAVTPANIDDLRWTTYVAMWDSTKE